MKIKVLGDEFTCLGFELAGIPSQKAEDRQTLRKEFNACLEDEELALILITEREAGLIRRRVDKQKTEGELPLVVEIPARSGWEERGKALKLINRVLSIKI